MFNWIINKFIRKPNITNKSLYIEFKSLYRLLLNFKFIFIKLLLSNFFKMPYLITFTLLFLICCLFIISSCFYQILISYLLYLDGPCIGLKYSKILLKVNVTYYNCRINVKMLSMWNILHHNTTTKSFTIRQKKFY